MQPDEANNSLTQITSLRFSSANVCLKLTGNDAEMIIFIRQIF